MVKWAFWEKASPHSDKHRANSQPAMTTPAVPSETSQLARWQKISDFRRHCFAETTAVATRFHSDLISALEKQTDEQVAANMERKELFKHEFVYRAMAELANKRLREGEDGLPRQYIVCPFEEKEQAKELGARWDSNKRKWYALGDETYEKLKKWHPSKPPTPTWEELKAADASKPWQDDEKLADSAVFGSNASARSSPPPPPAKRVRECA